MLEPVLRKGLGWLRRVLDENNVRDNIRSALCRTLLLADIHMGTAVSKLINHDLLFRPKTPLYDVAFPPGSGGDWHNAVGYLYSVSRVPP